MAKKKKSEPTAPPRPYCGLCRGRRYVPGPRVVMNGHVYEGRNNVPCECMSRPWPPGTDAQTRAAGEA